MKKLISILLVLCMMASIATVAVSAEAAAVQGATEAPDLIITEIAPDTLGNGLAGYQDNKDPFEFFEIYNNTDKTLNLYDYGIIYNGNNLTNAKFETVIVEYTPFLPGDWRDGTYTAEQWTDTSYEWAGWDNMPKNPDTCNIAPGECVVIWSMFNEAAYAMFNDGKGMTFELFREFWGIPQDVQVICWDGNSTVNRAGNDKNFNLKNSGTGTYGIVQKSDVIAAAANVEGSTYEINYWECPELVSWSVLSFDNLGTATIADTSFNFVVDTNYYGADEYGLVRDSRRALLVEAWAEATPGKLTGMQKLCLGQELAAGDAVDVSMIYDPYMPELGDFLGLKINGELYDDKSIFTAAAAGVGTIEYVYGKEEPKQTEAPTTTEAPVTEAPVTEAPATEAPTTEAPVTEAPATEAPTTNAPVTEAPKAEGGCGGFVALGIVACLVPAAIVVLKKRD